MLHNLFYRYTPYGPLSTSLKKEKKMRKSFFFLLLTGLFFSSMVPAFSQEKATREECIQKNREAAALIQKVGMEKAFDTFMDTSGPFVWKDTYVFVISMEGKVVVHPITPRLNGRDFSGLTDVTGKMFVNEYITVAKDPGEGWVDYMWPKPGEKTPVAKTSHVLRVPGEDLIVIAGIYIE